MPAARAFWMLSHGLVPLGAQVLHRCDNSFCVNPEHLYLGTNADNRKDQSDRQLFCVHGHKFTPENTARFRRGGKVCIECNRVRARANYARYASHKAALKRRARAEARAALAKGLG
jgi:hypothetical protein